jgi:hypothetical protein
VPGKRHGEFFVELDDVEPASTADPLWVQTASVGHNYFSTFGVAIVSGRDFAASDIDFERPVAVVDETFVQQVMGGRDTVGMRIREPHNSERPQPGPWLEIIGVVENLTRTAAATSENAVLYRPLAPGTSSAYAVIHARRDAGGFAARLRNVAAEADPTVRLYETRTLDTRDALDAVLYEFMLWALGIVGAVALLLSVAGVYSLISFTLARRTTEIGIRTALGAAPGRIVAAIFSRAFKQVGLGLVAGSVPGAAIVAYGGGEATRGMGPALGAACALAIAMFIIAVTALACLSPTRRALRIEPTTALRADR